jgi:hypothetical protein
MWRFEKILLTIIKNTGGRNKNWVGVAVIINE